MIDSRMTGLKRLIAMLCMVAACLSPVRAISASAVDLEHALELAHAISTGEDIVHYCEMSSEGCERQPHDGDGRATSHHHHGDPSSGFTAVSGHGIGAAVAMSGLSWPMHGLFAQGLGPSALDRPPRA